MPKIALVEDEAEAADVLASFIDRYGTEKGTGFTVVRFCNAIDFELTRQKFDLVFMDIQMPGIDGMEAAHLMRTYDSETPIIFVTNLAQYAVKGYEVDALDFIVKPVSYYNFRMRMDKAMRRIARVGGRSVVINTRDGLRVASVSDIEYVERPSTTCRTTSSAKKSRSSSTGASRPSRKRSREGRSCGSRTAAS